MADEKDAQKGTQDSSKQQEHRQGSETGGKQSEGQSGQSGQRGAGQSGSNPSSGSNR